MDNTQIFPFVKAQLQCDAREFEPQIDVKTMELHHGAHFDKCVACLNGLVEAEPELQSKTLRELINLPVCTEHNPIIAGASAVYNHAFYFDSIRPSTGQIIFGLSQRLNAMLERDFGGLDGMREQILACALDMNGVGYVWVVIDAECKMRVISVHGDETPLQKGYYPLLCLDMWEHAYYLRYHNDIAQYVKNFLNLIDFAKFSRRLDEFYASNLRCKG